MDKKTVEHIIPISNLYTEARRGKVKDETVSRDLKTVRAALNQAVQLFPNLEDFIPPKIRFLKTEKTRCERIVNSTELRSILFYLLKPQGKGESEETFLSRRRAELLFLLSAVTGARPGELVCLKKSDILEDLQVLRITGKKTRFKTAKTVRYFPLVSIVRRILDEAVEIKLGEFIFSQKGTITPTYYHHVKAACEASGIVYGRKTAGGLIPYDPRHTETTLIMHSGADFETVSSITRQSRHSLWRYTHTNENSIKAVVSILEKFAETSFDGLGLDKKEDRESLRLAQSTK